MPRRSRVLDFDPDAEWLEADGQGGFASGTAGLVRTRRYHALLLAADPSPSRRFVLVNGIEAWVETPAGRFALSSQAYAPDTVFPDGRWRIAGFTALPWPCWTFAGPDGTRITQELFVARGPAETVLRWQADRPVRLTVRPLLSGRDYHALHHENPAFDATTRHESDALLWQPYPGVPATTARGNFAWTDGPDWYRGFTYAAEAARGLDDGEDLLSPGAFTWEGSGPAVLVLRAGSAGTAGVAELEAAERTRRARTRRDVAANAYLAVRGDGQTVLAGFPWFTDWGRDTFIALRGLLIARGRLAEAAGILLAWAGHVSEGMLPNRFPDGDGPPEYNSADASLWFIVAVHELMEAGAPAAAAARLQAAALAILEGYAGGARYGIAADPKDGLLRAGVPGMQLTWMDAKTGGHVVTPRIGKPVELQALWVNALAIAGRWPGGSRWVGAALRARDSVTALFPDRDTGGLIDVLDADGVPGARDRRVRPNQVLAAGGLPIPVLTPRQVAGVAALAERDVKGLYKKALAPWRRTTRPTARTTAAARRSATAPTTRARCGPGCSARSSPPGSPAAAARRRRRRRAARASCRRCTRTFTPPDSATCRRWRTATPRTRRAAARSRPGRWAS